MFDKGKALLSRLAAAAVLIRLSPALRRQLGCAILSLVSGSVMAAAVDVVHAEFGLFESRGSQDMLFTPARIIPHKPGTRYGWVIELRTDRRSLSVREEYLLPISAGEAPSAKDAIVIQFERRNPVSQRQLVPRNGLIFGEWEIGPGEPPGKRHLQVMIEGEVAASFEYEVR